MGEKCIITIWSREYDITHLRDKALPNKLTLSRSDILRIGEVPFDRTIQRDRGDLELGDAQSCDVQHGDVFYAIPQAQGDHRPIR